MRITPLDVRKQEFRKVVRGLDGEEVYAFLATVADEYEAVLTDNKQLRDKVLDLDEKVSEYRNMEKTLRDTLLTAERVVADARQNAKKEADLILRDARLVADQETSSIGSRVQSLKSQLRELRGHRDAFIARLRGLTQAQEGLIESYLKDFDSEDGQIDDVLAGRSARTEARRPSAPVAPPAAPKPAASVAPAGNPAASFDPAPAEEPPALVPSPMVASAPRTHDQDSWREYAVGAPPRARTMGSESSETSSYRSHEALQHEAPQHEALQHEAQPPEVRPHEVPPYEVRPHEAASYEAPSPEAPPLETRYHAAPSDGTRLRVSPWDEAPEPENGTRSDEPDEDASPRAPWEGTSASHAPEDASPTSGQVEAMAAVASAHTGPQFERRPEGPVARGIEQLHADEPEASDLDTLITGAGDVASIVAEVSAQTMAEDVEAATPAGHHVPWGPAEDVDGDSDISDDFQLSDEELGGHLAGSVAQSAGSETDLDQTTRFYTSTSGVPRVEGAGPPLPSYPADRRSELDSMAPLVAETDPYEALSSRRIEETPETAPPSGWSMKRFTKGLGEF